MGALLPSSLDSTLVPAFINAVVTILNVAVYRNGCRNTLISVALSGD